VVVFVVVFVVVVVVVVGCSVSERLRSVQLFGPSLHFGWFTHPGME
jgi:hypothetical protein